MTGEDGKVTISRDALIPIGSAAAMIVTAVTAVVWINSALSEINTRLQEITYRIDRQDERSADRWTAQHQQLWAATMQRNNPTLEVPSVSEILR